jgi:hypothetical protein
VVGKLARNVARDSKERKLLPDSVCRTNLPQEFAVNSNAYEQGKQHSRDMLDAETPFVLMSRMTNLLMPLAAPPPYSQT